MRRNKNQKIANACAASCGFLRAGLAAFLLLYAPHAFAACSSPGGNAGDIAYSSTTNTMVYCNGTNWVSMGSSYVTSFGTLIPGDLCTAISGTQISCTTTGINLTSQVTGILPSANGGTGVNNGSNTITLGGNISTAGAFTTAGAYSLTLTTTGTTNVTLPTSGTLLSTAGVGTITSGVWNGSIISGTYGGTGVNNGSNTITLGGNLATSGGAITLTATGATNVTLPTSGTLVNTAVTSLPSLAGVGTITSGTWNGTAVTVPYGGTGLTTLTSGTLYKGNGTSALSASALSDNGTIVSSTESIDATSNGFVTEITNAGTTGTTANKLAKLNTSGAAVIATTTDTDGVLGVVVGGAGTTGTAQIAVDGQASCVFDGATTAGDFVTISTTTAGDCHDAGATRSTTTQTIGRVLSTNGSGGTYTIAMGLNGANTGSITGTGTTNYTARWTGVTTLGTGALYDNGTNVGIGTTGPNSLLHVFDDANSTGYLSLAQFTAGNNSGATNFSQLQVGQNATSNMFIDVNVQGNTKGNLLLMPWGGAVGIGTTSPSQRLSVNGNVDVLGANGYLTEIANDGTTGTVAYRLAKLNTSGAAVLPATTDTDGVLGVVVGGAGTTGTAQIAVDGQASCVFDGATTAGDFVTISTTTAGDCHDAGATRSTTTQTIGRVLSTNGSGGTYAITMGLNGANTGSITGTGTTNYTARWTGVTTLGTGALYDNGTNVGIGTSSPNAVLDVYSGGLLHVAGVASPTLPVQGAYIGWNALTGTTGETDFLNQQGAGTGGFAFYNSSNTTKGTALMFINGSGNVGIGTTSPSTALQVNGTVTATQFVGGGSGLTGITPTFSGLTSGDFCTASSTTALGCSIGSTGTGSVVLASSPTLTGNLTFTSANPSLTSGGSFITIPNGIYVSGGTPYFQTQIQARGGIHNDVAAYLELDGGTSGYTYVNGSLGIGTASPGAPLEVAGAQAVPTYSTSNAFNPSGAIFAVHDTTGGNGLTVGVYTSANTYATWLQSGFQGNIVAPYAIALNPFGGNVGIGTSSPNAVLDVYSGGLLHVAGVASPTLPVQGAYIGWNALTGTTGETDFLNQQGAGTGGFAFYNSSNTTKGTALMFINGSGNVGIGTTSPAQKLDVEGSGQTIIQVGDSTSHAGININSASTSYVPYVRFSRGGTGGFEIGKATSNNFYFNNTTGGADVGAAMVISSTGSVGIGTASPGQLLAVNGNAQIGSFNILPSSGFDGRTINIQDATTTSGTFLGVLPHGSPSDWGGVFYVGYSDYVANSTNYSLLQLRANRSSGLYEMLSSLGGSGSLYPIGIGANGSSSQLYLATNGNIGIGTTSPFGTLDVFANGGWPAANFENATSGALAEVRFTNAGNVMGHIGYENSTGGGLLTDSLPSSFIIRATNALHLVSSSGPAERGITVDTSGNVGVGLTNPATRLHVSTAASGLLPYAGYYNGLNMAGTLSEISASTTSTSTVYTGLNLENSSQTNNTYSPFISFSRLSDSGSFTMPYAAIGAQRTGVGGDTNWNAGDLVFGTEQIGAYSVTEKMRITNAGNVGIGTASPSSTLQVNGTVTATQFVGGGSGLTGITPTFSGLTSGDFCTASSTTALGCSIGSTGTGSVVLASSPTLTGNLTFTSANPSLTSGGSYITIPNGIYVSGGTPYFQTQIQARGGIHNDVAAYLELDGGTNGFTYVNGSLGIGTNLPAFPLTAAGGPSTAPVSSASGTFQVGNNSNGGVIDMGTNGTNGWIQGTSSYNYASYLPLLLNPLGGNVGIGTTSPSSALQVNGTITASSSGTATTTSAIYGTNTSTGYGVVGVSSTSGTGIYGSNSGGGFGVYGTNSSSSGVGVYGVNTSNGIGAYFNSTSGYALITGAGNVGIGTSSPSSALQVNGTVSASASGSGNTLSASNSGTGAGVYGSSSSSGPGVYGSNSSGGKGVFGDATGTGIGVYGNNGTGTGYGVYASNNSTGYGLYALNGSSGYAGYFLATSGTAGYFTSNSGYALITGAGNVGIGTTSPSSALQVNGTITATSAGNTMATSAVYASNTSTGAGIWGSNMGTTGGVGVEGMSAGTNGVGVYAASLSSSGYGVYGINTSSGIGGYFSSTSGYALVTEIGKVGIGTMTPRYLLDVNGTISATGGANYLSDVRHKKNVKDLTTGLDAVEKLRPVTFEWKDPKDKGMQGTQTGFIAQEVEKVLPSTVMTEDNAEKTKNMKYNEIIPVLTKALQQVKALFDTDHDTLTKLKAENTDLRNAADKQAKQIEELRKDMELLKAARK